MYVHSNMRSCGRVSGEAASPRRAARGGGVPSHLANFVQPAGVWVAWAGFDLFGLASDCSGRPVLAFGWLAWLVAGVGLAGAVA